MFAGTLSFAGISLVSAENSPTENLSIDVQDLIADTASSSVSIEDKPEIAFSSNLKQAVLGIINYALGFLGIVAVIIIIASGVQLVLQGEDKADEVKKRIQWAVVGIILILLSYSIVNFILSVGDQVA
jgi:type IV secretory pathway VirB2 component (pilin)